MTVPRRDQENHQEVGVLEIIIHPIAVHPHQPRAMLKNNRCGHSLLAGSLLVSYDGELLVVTSNIS